MPSKAKQYAERVAEQFIRDWKAGTAPYQQPWDSTAAVPGLPFNPVSGKRYRGINTVWFQAQGHRDPRWLTYAQAKKAGWQVKRGEKSTLGVFWTMHKEEKQEDGAKVRVELERPIFQTWHAFNAEQIDGIPELIQPERDWDPNERAEELLIASGADIRHVAGNQAFYSPSRDYIQLPELCQFDDAGRYYATALHELSHWTGHKSRLDRDMTGRFGSEEYAKEELRAEIASYMIGCEVGVGHDPGQHTAYVASWIKALQEDPYEIFRASRDAEKVMDYVLQFDRFRDQAQAERDRIQGETLKPREEAVREFEHAHERGLEMAR